MQSQNAMRKPTIGASAAPRIVIVGAGFGGLWAAKQFMNETYPVTLIDRNNYHSFFPLLYQVAAAEIAPEEIVYPARGILRGSPHIQFVLGTCQSLDLEARLIRTEEHTIGYDYLILATGSVPFFFGTPGAAAHAYPVRDLDQAIMLRNHILCCFERAAQERDSAVRRSVLTFVIVGGGPTGLEFAGALAELVRGPLKKDYPQLDLAEVRIMAKETLLPAGGFPAEIQEYAGRRLHDKGVLVQLAAMVQAVLPNRVVLAGGSSIDTETVIWTAGVRADPSAAEWNLPTTKSGQIEVLSTLQAAGFPQVYAVGDLAAVRGYSERPLPMVAPVAIQQGTLAARNILHQIDGEPLEEFHYRDRGMMVVMGRNAAGAYLFNRWAFTGFLAWLMWLGIHLFNLIGFQNKLMVMIQWARSYIFFDRALRLIIPGRRCRPADPGDALNHSPPATHS